LFIQQLAETSFDVARREPRLGRLRPALADQAQQLVRLGLAEPELGHGRSAPVPDHHVEHLADARVGAHHALEGQFVLASPAW